jgi:hypothetical protein
LACFTNGISICTLKGEVPVEDLQVGDRVITRDNGLQTVKRISRRDIDYGQLAASRHLQPILVMAGALGHGLPERDTLVSPNLRLLHASDVDGADRLVSVKNLVDNRLVRNCSVLGVRYVHIEFMRHEVVLANGIWAESFHSEDRSLGARGNAQRTELFDIYPDRKSEAPAKIAAAPGALMHDRPASHIG